MKCGINGAQRDITDVPSGINGAVRTASELWQGKNGATQKVWPLIPIGYQVILDTVGSGEWVCPASGDWQAELHGGGGGGGGGGSNYYGGGGGGSGELYTMYFASGQQVNYSIGSGGVGGRGYSLRPLTQAQAGSVGGNTTFGSYSIAGGGSGGSGTSINGAKGGPRSGSLSGRGNDGGRQLGVGGLGNAEKSDQPYGTGGTGGTYLISGAAAERGADGEDGAIILTYLG